MIESLNYEYLEKKTYLEEIKYNLFENRFTLYSKINKSKDRLFSDFIILNLNNLSNRFRTSFVRGIIFTICVSLLFFYLSMLATDRYYFDFRILINWNDMIPNFFSFINPVHKPNYLGESFLKEFKLSNWFYFWDFLGRIFVGYGLYQTIQAFRKYK